MTVEHIKTITLKGNKKEVNKTEFENVIFSNSVQIQSYLGAGDFTTQIHSCTFSNCRFEQGVNFKVSVDPAFIGTISISFSNCYIGRNFHKNLSSINSDEAYKVLISFSNCFIEGLEFINSRFHYLGFSRVIFGNSNFGVKESCDIESINIHNSLGNIFLNECTNSKIRVVFADDNLFLERSNVNKGIKSFLKQQNINKIFAYKTSYHISNPQELYVEFTKSNSSGYRRMYYEINRGKIAYFLNQKDLELLNISLAVDTKKNQTNNINIKNAIIESLTLRGFSDTEVNIENTKCQNVYIHDFKTKQLKLYNIEARRKQGLFEVKNSNLTNAWFDKVKLNSFDICSFYRTTLENTTFSATEFPKDIKALENIHYPEKIEENYYDALYENYRQIKTALLNQNNHIQALEMHKQMYNAIRKSKKLELQDRIILLLNRISNNHGTSISRAFFLSISLIFIIGIIYCLTLPNAPYQFGWNGFGSFGLAIKNSCYFVCNNAKSFFILANPAHKLSSLIAVSGVEELSSTNYFISLISRLVIAWAYFQFVSAFRKFGKQL